MMTCWRVLGLVVLAVCAAPIGAQPNQVTNSLSGTEDHSDCAAIWATSEPELQRSIRQEEHGILAATDGSLEVTADEHSQLRIIGSDNLTAEVEYMLCKSAWADDPDIVEGLLLEVEAVLDGARLGTRGPGRSRAAGWSAHLLVKVPRAWSVVAISSRGALELSGLTGRVEASSESGGIRAEASRGGMTVRSVNGSVVLDVRARDWTATSIGLHSRNGSVRVNLYEGSDPAILVRSRFGELRCTGIACHPGPVPSETEKQWRIGRGRPALQISTVHGPVAVRAY